MSCLLKLGSLESVLNQVTGLVHTKKNDPIRGEVSSLDMDKHSYAKLLPHAAEAAWRLGRWSVLEQLVDGHNEKTAS
eukprot:14278434-Ditylum_brightwellii.AAC.1